MHSITFATLLDYFNDCINEYESLTQLLAQIPNQIGRYEAQCLDDVQRLQDRLLNKYFTSEKCNFPYERQDTIIGFNVYLGIRFSAAWWLDDLFLNSPYHAVSDS